MKRTIRFGMTVLATLALAVSAVSADVMDHVPGDSMVVIKANNLKGISDKVAGLAQRFGVAPFLPSLANPIGSLETELKVTKGINESGDAALAFLDPAKYTAPDKHPGVLLIPVSDYAAFVSNFSRPTSENDKAAPDNATAPATQTAAAAPTADAQGITTIAFPNAFDTSYVAKWGDYAAISDTHDLVVTPATGLKASGLSAKELSSKDVIVYANMAAIRAKALPPLQANREKYISEMQNAMSRNPGLAPMKTMLQGAGEALFNDLERILQDAQGATYGISIEKTGIRTTILAEFTPESPIGQTVSQIKNSDQTLLVGLPAENYLFYGGMAWDPQQAAQISDAIVGPIRDAFAKMGDNMQPVVKSFDLYHKFFAACEGTSFGWIAPTGALGQSSLVNIVGVQTGDVQTMIDVGHQNLDLQPSVNKLTSGNGMDVTTSFTANAKTLSGVSLNEFKMQFAAGPNATMQQRQGAKMINMLYGPNGIDGYTGAVDAKHMVVGLGSTDDQITHAIDAIKGGQDPVGTLPELKDVQANLPTQRLAAFYVPLDQIAKTAAGYARQFGLPLNLQLPPNMAPIGMTAGTEQSAIRFDSFVPTQTVQSLIAAGMQAYFAAQGGGGGL